MNLVTSDLFLKGLLYLNFFEKFEFLMLNALKNLQLQPWLIVCLRNTCFSSRSSDCLDKKARPVSLTASVYAAAYSRQRFLAFCLARDQLAEWLAGMLAKRLARRLAEWLAVRLATSLAGRQAERLAGRLAERPCLRLCPFHVLDLHSYWFIQTGAIKNILL